MSLHYEIMPVKDMFTDIGDLARQFVSQDAFTMASVYRGNSGSYYLVPAVGSLGIRSAKEVIDSIIKSGLIPIEEKDTNLFLPERDRFLNIWENVAYYVNDLSNKLQIPVTAKQEIDTALYNDIDSKIKSSPPQEAYKSYFIPLGVVIGEITREKAEGEWKLDKRYACNPYFVPYIKSKRDTNYLPWYKLADMLLDNKFDMKKYIENVSQERRFL